MEIKIELTSDQVLSLSKDLQGHIPSAVEANIPKIVEHMLTVIGEEEERRAYASKLQGSSWERDQRVRDYETLRSAVIKKVAENLHKSLMDEKDFSVEMGHLKEWFREHRAELLAQAFGAWFDRALQNMAASGAGSNFRLDALINDLRAHVNPNIGQNI